MGLRLSVELKGNKNRGVSNEVNCERADSTKV